MSDRLNEVTKALNETSEFINIEKTLHNRINSAEVLSDEANVKLKALKIQLIKEEKDVENLQKLSIANILHTIMKDKVEAEEKELSEVIQVKNTIDNLIFDIEDSDRRILRLRSERKGINKLEEKYKLLLDEKLSLIEGLFPTKWQSIMEKNKEVEDNNRMKKEIEEAIYAGKSALSSADEIILSLRKAKSWGTYDMLGGGLIATMAKRSHIDDAQHKLTRFRGGLRAFNQELGDVGKVIDSSIDIGEFLRFSDWFFDGFFVDWAVQSKIINALSGIEDIYSKIKELLGELRYSNEMFKRRNVEINSSIENYIIETV